ncbi:MAG TPA: molybdate ABC transporter substrate-binding protein [Candidatus Saccharimonadia bacterium]|nr:molybdate ABC transporter substrate-binding protein [Candidatus Saccharimonadia bacterium]
MASFSSCLRFALLAAACMLPASLMPAQSPTLRVSAAASLADALKEIHSLYEKKTGGKIELNLGASSMLARQIEEGAPVDVFISADLAKMEGLEKKGLIHVTTKENQLSNALVVVVPADSKLQVSGGKSLAEAGVAKIAFADPKAVPAGMYSKEWLTKLGLWEKIEPKVISTENVRAALAAVESGNVDAGIVYKTDAAISQKVKVAFEVPASEGPVMTYPMAALKSSAHSEAAKQYLDFLDTPEAKAVFAKFGFVVLPEA